MLYTEVTMIVSSSMHPYYAMLSTTGKNLYIEMLRYAISGARKFNVKTKTTVVVAKQAFTAMYFDHPQLFWLDGSSVYETQNDILVSFEFGFNSLAKNLSRNQSNLKAAIERYLKDVRNGWEMTPKVRLDVMDAYDVDYCERRAEKEWPLKRTEYRKYYLDANVLVNN